MSRPDEKWQVVTNIRNKINMRNKNIENKKKKNPDEFLSISTLLRRIREFCNLGEEEQHEYLVNGPGMHDHGGSHYHKVTKETLLCIIVLVLDFPTLSAPSIAKYLNSKYGPNYAYDNQISARTVQRYLSKFKFRVKKASFSPPTRNNIGLRIFRVAWSKIMEDILRNENVLLAFVDEAAVTDCDGCCYGRAFAGITPVMNCPLSKVKSTIVAIAIPCYGILYTFIDQSCTGTEYARFLNEATHFIRKYICNKDTEIVIIEDNCPIHSTEEVENEIEKLKIALLPIVPYSPCLNEVIEGYFGLIKCNNYLTTSYSSIISIESAIEFNWKILTHQLCDDKKSVQLLSDWFNRLEYCKTGVPIYPKHISSDTFKDYSKLFKNLTVTVDRLKGEINH